MSKVAEENIFSDEVDVDDLLDRLKETKQRLQKVREDMPAEISADERSAIVRALLVAEVDYLNALLDEPLAYIQSPLETVSHLFQRSMDTIHKICSEAFEDDGEGDFEDEDEDNDGDNDEDDDQVTEGDQVESTSRGR